MKKTSKLTNAVCKFSITFDDTAEGRVRLFIDGKFDHDVHFDTYGQALRHIDELRDNGWLPLTPGVEAIEALLQTAEKYHRRMAGSE